MKFSYEGHVIRFSAALHEDVVETSFEFTELGKMIPVTIPVGKLKEFYKVDSFSSIGELQIMLYIKSNPINFRGQVYTDSMKNILHQAMSHKNKAL